MLKNNLINLLSDKNEFTTKSYDKFNSKHII